MISTFTLAPELKFNKEDFKFIKQIGHGSNAVVNEVENVNTKKRYAAKVLKKPILPGDELNDIELKILSNAKSPAILNLVGYSISDNKLTIYTELFPNNNLMTFLNSQKFPEDWRAKKYLISLGIAMGMDYLHSIGYSHRDLKPENILLNDLYLPIISDFGISKQFSESDIMETIAGTPRYLAPEVLRGEPYDSSCDVYSYSILLLELMSDKILQEQIGFYKFITEVTSGKRPAFPPYMDERIKKLISSCWDDNPRQRLKFNNIIDELTEEYFYSQFEIDTAQIVEYIDKFGERYDYLKKKFQPKTEIIDIIERSIDTDEVEHKSEKEDHIELEKEIHIDHLSDVEVIDEIEVDGISEKDIEIGKDIDEEYQIDNDDGDSDKNVGFVIDKDPEIKIASKSGIIPDKNKNNMLSDDNNGEKIKSIRIKVPKIKKNMIKKEKKKKDIGSDVDIDDDVRINKKDDDETCIKPIDDSAKKIKITGNDDDYTPTIKIKVPKVIKKRKK